MSQADLAARSGLPLDNVRNWEQGRVLPRVDALKRLSLALGVSADKLIAEVEVEPPAEPPPAPKPPATRSKKRKNETK
jgi:transcriptional regulator with XRE-family HTH domain